MSEYFEANITDEEYQKAVTELCEILCCNINIIDFKELNKLVKRRAQTWHPDKNLDNPRKEVLNEKLKNLNGAWTIYKSFKQRDQEENLNTDDSEDDFEAGGESTFFDSPYFSAEFFNVSPSKTYNFPEFCKLYFRSENCRRAGKQLILCLPEKTFDYEIFTKLKLNAEHYSIFKYENVYLISILLFNEIRYFDIKKIVKSLIGNFKCNFSIRYSKFQTELIEKCGIPIHEFGEYKKPKSSDDKTFSHFLLAEYAKKYEITNVYEIMSNYSHFATHMCNHKSPSNDHLEDHEFHLENAKKYVHLSDRKKFAKNAVEVVKAEQFMSIKKIKNSDFIQNKIIEISHAIDIESGLIESISEHAYFFTEIVCKKNFKTMMECFKFICTSFYEGESKKRYSALIGPFNTGKSSIAYAFLSLFTGRAINCNVEFSRLGFFLGEALDQRFVLFDDVSHKGMKNLDELRDHIDGRIPVLLEKKNVQPMMQKFPAGIITSNVPLISTLKVRVKEFVLEPLNMEGHSFQFDERILFIVLVIWNLIPVESYIMKQVAKAKYKWEEFHVNECEFCKKHYESS